MPLIVCPECSRLMSDKAKICPYCGAPNASLSFGSRSKEFAKSAESFLEDADEKYEKFLETPAIKNTLEIARFVGLFVATIIVLTVIFCVWRIYTPQGPDYYQMYSKNNRASLYKQCNTNSLAVYDQGYFLSTKPTWRSTTLLGCFGYIDAVNEKLGLDVESAYDAFFKDQDDEVRALVEGISLGCNMSRPFAVPSDYGREGEDVLSYQDGRQAFRQDKAGQLMLVSKENSQHVRKNLDKCVLQAKDWENFPRISSWFIKIGVPLPRFLRNQRLP